MISVRGAQGAEHPRDVEEAGVAFFIEEADRVCARSLDTPPNDEACQMTYPKNYEILGMLLSDYIDIIELFRDDLYRRLNRSIPFKQRPGAMSTWSFLC